ncbi:tRNA glutamyl-Q(34) synthetase GluQRS [Amylibacter kogurei]|uniref:tRNA glutamyl-Q(34) synthetase GluQRS n=1 Tax=Paramylibacter kogurei TaxID=1889778 RepID=A0A2G5K721_9RHOB|nr:tRNA glutamyl-Q(34) synthetase GluQRS [Amylibacter kogurei]PIB24670.1 tRNA glutamyl-Q(34) synthetase GluQRS [Amylibacter kogurei]
MIIRERFAPSPTGLLHLGHAYSALTAYDCAMQGGGEFLLRIEDIDQTRCKTEFENAIFDDLAWLGITWETPVMRQSERTNAYQNAIQSLWDRGLLYACDCTRKDIAIASAPQEDGEQILGPDGIIYPGTCRNKPRREIPNNAALRLDMARAIETLTKTYFTFNEIGIGPNQETGSIRFDANELINKIGDIVLARKDIATSYHLAVVIDDHAQNITHVTRGYDLFDATKIHILLQNLLGLHTPIYRHHKLIRDENGKRLAKRYDAMAIQSYRHKGFSPAMLRALFDTNA